LSFTIRKATLEDLPDIMEELKNFDKFYDSKKKLYRDDETTSAVIGGLIENHVFFVAENNRTERVVGFISGLFCPHMYNPDIMTLVETFWWVNPEYRNTRAGLQLLNAYVDYGKENADWIICTIEADSPVNEKSFYKRGFKLKERSFLMEVH